MKRVHIELSDGQHVPLYQLLGLFNTVALLMVGDLTQVWNEQDAQEECLAMVVHTGSNTSVGQMLLQIDNRKGHKGLPYQFGMHAQVNFLDLLWTSFVAPGFHVAFRLATVCSCGKYSCYYMLIRSVVHTCHIVTGPPALSSLGTGSQPGHLLCASALDDTCSSAREISSLPICAVGLGCGEPASASCAGGLEGRHNPADAPSRLAPGEQQEAVCCCPA